MNEHQTLKRDPWSEFNTCHGYHADQVISALQKEIRRGNTENAVLLAYEMAITSPELEDYLWQRLLVISVEDIGYGDLNAPLLVHALYRIVGNFKRSAGERKLFAIHAVRYLCGCLKDRSSDEMFNWVKQAVERGEARPSIPDYALDMHTAEGKVMGRGRRHFYEEGARLAPELSDRELKYRQWIMKLLDEEEKE